MEFLRFGSSIPGSYWGCCACCIIQNFKVDPDEPASIELVCGDGGEPLGDRYYGKTYREIFHARIMNGTFSEDPMPNHVFLAILTEGQINGGVGKKWLKILSDYGFEFIRSTSNSVYSGEETVEDYNDYSGELDSDNSRHINHVFGLFRNIGTERLRDPFSPPSAWVDLDQERVKQVSDFLSDKERAELLESQFNRHLNMWDPAVPTYSQQELKDAKIPITMAGRRPEKLQQPLYERELILKAEENRGASSNESGPSTGNSQPLEPVTF